jgi:hypothetical protein
MGYSFNPMPDPQTNEHGDMVSLRDYLSLQAQAHNLARLLMEGRDLVEEYSRANAAGIAREEALRATIAELQRENLELRNAAVEVCALARVWVTVWGDKLSAGSIKRLGELEKKILKETQP